MPSAVEGPAVSRLGGNDRRFQRALLASLVLHAGLITLIVASPKFPRAAPRGPIRYVNLALGGPGGSGGPGAAASRLGATAVPAKRETLRDLTTPLKAATPPKSDLRYPVPNPKKEKTPPKDKKAAISPTPPPSKAAPAEEAEPNANGGSGLRIGGIGDGAGGGGGVFGSEYGDQIGLSTFPYTYYLQILTDKVSAAWFTSLVDPGVRGTYTVTVYFKIYRDGRISDLKVEEASQIRSLDLSALRAITSAAPFPPLPEDYDQDYLGIHLIFEHSK
jgi:TonB family protein